MSRASRAAPPAAIPPDRSLRGRRILLSVIGWSCFAAFVFAVALIATAPVSILFRVLPVPSQIEALYGSIWHGRADLVNGHVLTWDTDPGALLTGSLTAAFVLTGEGTRLTGTLHAQPFGIEARDVAGRAGTALLSLADGMPELVCTTRGIVDIALLGATRSSFAADGLVTIEPGACTEANGRTTPVPPMQLTLSTQGDNAVARLQSDATLFLTAEVQGTRRILLRIEPEGARNVPGLPSGGPITLDFPF